MAKKPMAKSNGHDGDKPAKASPEATPAKAATPVAGDEADAPQISPEIAAKIAQVRSTVRENFGKAVMAMMMLPRYRQQTVGDLQHLVLEPLIRDRIAIAYPAKREENALQDMTGFAIWASVSEEVDTRIREQVAAGVFPVRLKNEDWNSGEINWLLDVIAPDTKTTASVIANFKQVVKQGSLRLHPLITRLVDEETLKKMGAEKMASPEAKTQEKPETVN